MHEKLYVIVRGDLNPGYQVVQSCHAIIQWSQEYPELNKSWFKSSNYIAALSVSTKKELVELLNVALQLGIVASCFKEPDIGDEITAIVLEPGLKSKKLCSNIGLALKNFI